jgi:hypothetical protein
MTKITDLAAEGIAINDSLEATYCLALFHI